MKKYRATLRYSRSWDVEIEADSLEKARESAEAWASSEDSVLDANEREWVSLSGVEEIEEEASV